MILSNNLQQQSKQPLSETSQTVTEYDQHSEVTLSDNTISEMTESQFSQVDSNPMASDTRASFDSPVSKELSKSEPESIVQHSLK